MKSVAELLRSRRNVVAAISGLAVLSASLSVITPQAYGATTQADAKAPTVSPATPPPYVSPEVWAKMLKQEPAIAAATGIQIAVNHLKPGNGFTGIILGDDSVELYWKGAVPDVIGEAVTRVKSMRP